MAEDQKTARSRRGWESGSLRLVLTVCTAIKDTPHRASLRRGIPIRLHLNHCSLIPQRWLDLSRLGNPLDDGLRDIAKFAMRLLRQRDQDRERVIRAAASPAHQDA